MSTIKIKFSNIWISNLTHLYAVSLDLHAPELGGHKHSMLLLCFTLNTSLCGKQKIYPYPQQIIYQAPQIGESTEENWVISPNSGISQTSSMVRMEGHLAGDAALLEMQENEPLYCPSGS